MYVLKSRLFFFFFCIAAIEYHNLNTSIATRDFWVVTGKDVIAFNRGKITLFKECIHHPAEMSC